MVVNLKQQQKEYGVVYHRATKKFGDKAAERKEKAEATKLLVENPDVSQGLFGSVYSKSKLFPIHPWYPWVGGDNKTEWIDLSAYNVETGETDYFHCTRKSIKNKRFFEIAFRWYKQIKNFPTHKGLLILDCDGEKVQWVFISREVMEECYELHIQNFPDDAGEENLKSKLKEFIVPTSKCVLLGEYISFLQDRYLSFPNNDVIFPRQFSSLTKFFA